MNQPKSRIVPLSPDHARRLADGIEQHEASFITPKGDGWLTPTERIYIASLLRNAAASETQTLVEVGEIVEIDDGMGTKFLERNEEGYKLPVGAKIYARR